MITIAPRPLAWQGLWAGAWLCCVLAVAADTAYGQAPPPCEPVVLTLIEAADLLRIDADEMLRLAEQQEVPARRIGSSWRFNCAALMAWLNGDWELITVADAPPAADPSSLVASGATPPSASDTLDTADFQDEPIGEAPEERTAEDVFLRGQRVLLGHGEVVLDFGQFYSRSDSHQLVSVDGGVGLATLEQEVLTTLLLGRVGILDETELFASTTFHYQTIHQFLGNRNLASSVRTGFGDVRVGIRRTLLREGVGRPNVIATLDGQIPTGDTPYGIGGGLVLVKRVDPVVLFAGANYLRTFGRDFPNRTRFEPENRLDVSMGYGLALNDLLAISMAFSGLFASTTSLNDVTLRQPNSFSGRFGLTLWLAEGLYIEPSVSFGLSDPGSSFAFGLTMPYEF